MSAQNLVSSLVSLVSSLFSASEKQNAAQWEMNTFFLRMAAGLSLDAFEALRKATVEGASAAIVDTLSKKDRAVWDGMSYKEKQEAAASRSWDSAALATVWGKFNTLSAQGGYAAVVARASILHEGFRNTEVAEYLRTDAKGKYIGNVTSTALLRIARAIEEEYKTAKKEPNVDPATIFAGVENGVQTATKPEKTDAEKIAAAWATLVKLASKSDDNRRALVEHIQTMLAEEAKKNAGTAPAPRRNRRPAAV